MSDAASVPQGGPALSSAGALTTTFEDIFAWARSSAFRPVRLGLACCAIEMTAAPGPSHAPGWPGGADGPSAAPLPFLPPAVSNVLIVAGTVSEKLAPELRRLWDQMPAPKWAIALGACASCGGPFPTYAVTQGIDRVIPIDVYVPGCPPAPEALRQGLLALEQKIARLLEPGGRR